MESKRPETMLLEVRDLRVQFAFNGIGIHVVDGVSFDIPFGKTVALVGESGCGKSVSALSLVGLIPKSEGHRAEGAALFRRNPSADAINLMAVAPADLRRTRGRDIGFVFQEPMSSFNPVLTIGHQIVETIKWHTELRGRDARSRCIELIERVGLRESERVINSYPHELSGGMLQRSMIAMALTADPALIIADEPTTALDVSSQSIVLDLLADLQRENGLSVLLITHDLGVVRRESDIVYVMYAGRIVERSTGAELMERPWHPYTRQLLGCTPSLAQRGRSLGIIPGSVPPPDQWPSGCRFHTRCSLAASRAGEAGRASLSIPTFAGEQVLRRCVESYDGEGSGIPGLRDVGGGHLVACWEADPDSCSVTGDG